MSALRNRGALLVSQSDSKDVLLKVAASLVAALIAGATRYIYRFLSNRRLRNLLRDDDCTPAEIKNGVLRNRSLYIRPDCQDNLPSDANPTNRRALFRELDRLLGPPRLARFVLVLADTGMGKSEFLQRYYAHHWRLSKRRNQFRIIVHALNGLDMNDLIRQIKPQTQSETVLLLDALDEDSAASEDFARRFDELLRLAARFRAVVVTCRSQFLTEAAFVPEEIDLPGTPGPMPLIAVPLRKVRRLYLSSLSDAQVRRYLAKRFPYWQHPWLRVRAKRAAERFKDLISRPLLLTFIQDLASSPEEPKYSFQAYRIIIAAWIEREIRKNQLKIAAADLLRICEEFAVYLFTSGRERASSSELQTIAERLGAGMFLRQVRERSLLHNDADGNWKFAHRSIMEYLLVNAASVAASSVRFTRRTWTDQMRTFAAEMLQSGECKWLSGADMRQVNLEGIDLSGCDLSEADLSRANLSGCRLVGANLERANLAEARMVHTQLDLTRLRDACLDKAELGQGDLGRVRGLTLLQAAAANADDASIWPTRIFEAQAGSILAVALNANGSRAVFGSSDGTVRIWDLIGNAPPREIGRHDSGVHAVALDAAGSRIVSGDDSGTLMVWEFDGTTPPRILTGHIGRIKAVGLSGDGSRAISGSVDKTVRIWDLEEPALPRVFEGHTAGVNAVALSADGGRAVSGSVDNTVCSWDLDGTSPPSILKGHTHFVTVVAVSRDGSRALSGSEDHTVRVWDLNGILPPRVLKGHTGLVSTVAFNSDESQVVSGSWDQTVRVWQVDGSSRILVGHIDSIYAVALSTDGNRALCGADDNVVRFWFPPDEPQAVPDPTRLAI